MRAGVALAANSFNNADPNSHTNVNGWYDISLSYGGGALIKKLPGGFWGNVEQMYQREVLYKQGVFNTEFKALILSVKAAINAKANLVAAQANPTSEFSNYIISASHTVGQFYPFNFVDFSLEPGKSFSIPVAIDTTGYGVGGKSFLPDFTVKDFQTDKVVYSGSAGNLGGTFTPVNALSGKYSATIPLFSPFNSPAVSTLYYLEYSVPDFFRIFKDSGKMYFKINVFPAKKNATITSIAKSVYLDANGDYKGHFWMNFKSTGSMNPAVSTSFKFNGTTYNGDTFTIPKADWNNPALATALANISVTIKPATTSVASAYNITPLTFSVDLKAAYATPVANAIPQLKIIAINGIPRLANQQNSPVTINAGDNVTFAIDQRNIKSIISLGFGGSGTTHNLSQTYKTYTVGYNSSPTYTPSIKVQLNTGGGAKTISGPTVTVNPGVMNPTPTPLVTGLTPLTATVGQLTTFTVTGTNLPKTIWMQLSGAACMAVYQSTATSAKVDCMPSGSGNTSFFIRDKKGGTILKGPSGRFVLVSAAPTVALPTVSISNVSKLEGNTKNSLLFFKIKLSAASTSAVTVQYSTTDGTATSAGIASDYIAKSGTLTISPGKTVGTIFVVIKGDTLVEPDQRFTVTLSAPTGAALASSSVAEGTIINDDFRVIKLNDTGIAKWGDATLNNLTTKQASFLGQDADLGRDARVAAGTLVKKGGGKAGFDFTKLDAVGQPLANQAAAYATTPWTCVQDNVTGLMWEVKTTPSLGGLRDAASSYTWYNSTGVNDGGNAGTPNGGFCVGGVNCDTEKYVAAVNAVGMCGFKDWRLPSVEALRSLVDLSVIPFGMMTGIDANYFPNTQASAYWAVSPDAVLSTTNAWSVSFDGGNAFSAPKSNTMTVRLVRGAW